MARVFIDGFEAGDLKLWTAYAFAGGGGLSAPVQGMDGNYCCLVRFNSDYLKKVVAPASEYYCAFRYRPINVVYDSNKTILFMSGGTTLGSLHRSGGPMVAYRGNASVELARSTTSLNIDTTHLIEIRYKPHATAGIFQVKIDGVLEIDYYGNTTAGGETFDTFNFWTTSGYNVLGYIDNFIVDNSKWPGNTSIQAIKPVGAGNFTLWTPSAGDNYACVDEVPASESDFIATNTLNHLDLYAAGDLVGTIGSVKCVQLQALAIAEGSPTPEHLQLAVRSNGADYFGDSKAVPSVVTGMSSLWEANPATAAPWLEAEVNAMEIGVKAVA
jgi:hypothetical protein